MAKNLICLISKQLLPNYVFLKEFAEPGDTVYFLATNTSDEQKNVLWDVFKKYKPGIEKIKTVPLYGVEEKWCSMLKLLESHFVKNGEYLINLTGGTKYMAQAVYEHFRDYPSAKFFYIPWPKNEYLDYHSDNSLPIKSKLSFTEYFDLRALTYQKEVPFLFQEYKDYSYRFFNKFINFSGQEKDIISLIREVASGKYNWEGIVDNPRLLDFLQKIEFPISKDELDKMGRAKRLPYLKYIAGGWFEEYARARLSQALGQPFYGINDLKVAGASKPNELDCVGIMNNHCIVVECKTVLEWSRDKTKEKWLEKALDKANRINKNIISTLSAHSYLFYLDTIGNESEIKKSLAQAENKHVKMLRAFGKEYFTNEAKFTEMINIIKEDCGC